jgi:hypothetical protein
MSTSKTVHDCRVFQSGWCRSGEQRQRNAGHRGSEDVQACTSPKHLAPLPRLYSVRAVQEEDELLDTATETQQAEKDWQAVERLQTARLSSLMFETTASAGAKGKGVKENGSAQQHL